MITRDEWEKMSDDEKWLRYATKCFLAGDDNAEVVIMEMAKNSPKPSKSIVLDKRESFVIQESIK